MNRTPASAIERARQLDRVLELLRRGRVSYKQWAETLDAWARGEDVARRDYGDSEPLSARITRSFDQPVTAAEVAYLLGVKENTAAVTLARMVARGQAQRVRPGEYVVQGPPTKKSPMGEP